MAIIEVNHQLLRSTANAVRDYCEVQREQMQKVDGEVKQMLYRDWTGPDSMEFGGKWEQIDSADGVSAKFLRSMESYEKALNACADVYQDAQERVYNIAALLLK